MLFTIADVTTALILQQRKKKKFSLESVRWGGKERKKKEKCFTEIELQTKPTLSLCTTILLKGETGDMVKKIFKNGPLYLEDQFKVTTKLSGHTISYCVVTVKMHISGSTILQQNIAVPRPIEKAAVVVNSAARTGFCGCWHPDMLTPRCSEKVCQLNIWQCWVWVLRCVLVVFLCKLAKSCSSRSKLYHWKQSMVTATLQTFLYPPCPSSNFPSLLFLTWGLATSIQMEGLFLFLFVYLFMHPAIRGIAGAFVPPQNANRHGG